MRKLMCLFYYGFARWLPVSYLPAGQIGKALRYFICRFLFQKCGKEVNIEFGAYFLSGSEISIGDHSSIGINAFLDGPVNIGSYVMMGPQVTIWTRNHEFSRTDIPMEVQGFGPVEPVTIEDDVWIGSHVIILPGVTIGRGSIVGAGSVVTKNVAEYTITAGNPAKVIKSRGQLK